MRLIEGIINTAFSLFDFFEKKPKTKSPAKPELVAKRFRQIFIDHGVEETQIPRVFSKITLDDLKSDESLFKKLTPEIINQVAELFKIRVEWLEGVSEVIYDELFSYKDPKQFFETLKAIQYESLSFPFRIITTTQKFNYKNKSYQPFTILFVEKIAELGEKSICRYQLDTGWSWDYLESRIQIKAMAKIYWRHAHQPITIYKVSNDIYEQIEDLKLIPFHHLHGALSSEPSLEDYVIDLTSPVSKEAEELPAVFKYIEDKKLSDVIVYRSTSGSKIDIQQDQDNQSDIDQAISERNRKYAKTRYQSLDKLKEQFKDYFEKNNYTNKSKAARDYFSNLSFEDKKIVVPSYYEKDHDNCLEKAVRTLSNYLKQ